MQWMSGRFFRLRSVWSCATALVISVTILSGCGTDSKLDSGKSETAVTERQPRASKSRIAASSAPAVLGYSKQFVGSQACSACHTDVADEYQTHPMAHAMAVAADDDDRPENISESKFITTPSLSYRVEEHDGKIFHHERRIDSKGEVVYDQAVPIDYAVGSGSRGRSYLTNMDGRLYQSAVSWYTDGPKWGLSPGYAPEYHERFERRVTHACLACHSGRANPHPTDTNRFGKPAFLEHAIGCERCHGAGGEHIEFHQTKQATSQDSDPIVNPERLSSGRKDAVCTQCHLQGRRRILQYGRSEFDFRPGMNISDIWVTLVKTAGIKSGTAAAVSQVEQMYESQCYKKSDGQLTCISCHDPHRRPNAGEAANFYRQRCLNCHDSGQTECSEVLAVRQHSDSDSCISCHMPSFAALDVHAAQTDHRVLKQQPLPTSQQPDNAARELTVFSEPDVRLSQRDIDRAKAIFLAEMAYLGGNSELAQQAIPMLIKVVESNRHDTEALLAMGKAMMQMGQPEMAMRAWTTILQDQPRHEEALEAIAALTHQSGQLEQAEQTYKELLNVNPTRSRYLGRMAHVLGQLGKFPEGIAAAEAALAIDPSLAQAHGWLAEAYRSIGDIKKADDHAQKFELFRSNESQDAGQ